MPLAEDVEDAGPEEGEGEEDEEAVGGLAAAVLADQLPALPDGRPHRLELVVGVANRRRGLRKVLNRLRGPLHRRGQLPAEEEGRCQSGLEAAVFIR